MIKELHQKLKNKEISSQQLVADSLDKIAKNNKEINAFLEVYKSEALEQAKSVDEKINRGEKIGLLEGIPMAIKDNLCVAGKKTTCSSRILSNYKAVYDATVVKKIKKAGAIILGKTNLDEFAMGSSTENSAFGPTKNPIDLERVAGGSSGGSAAAVASGVATWALGSDTGGSIRQPASLCGLVGMKPTYGRVSRFGLVAMASSFDQIGPLTQTVEDSALVFDAIYGEDEKDNTVTQKEADGYSFAINLNDDLSGKKIGVVDEFFGKGLDDQIEKTIRKKIELAEKAGAEIVQLKMPFLKYAMAVYYLMMPCEVSSNLARFDGIKYGLSDTTQKESKSRNISEVYFLSRKLGFGSEVKRRIILGTYALSAGYKDAYYKKAQKVRELIKADFLSAFEKVDAIVSPTSPTVAFRIGEKSSDPLEMYLSDIYTVSANVAMVPAISIPIGTKMENGKNLPFGLHLMTRWWDEQGLFNLAAGFEKLG